MSESRILLCAPYRAGTHPDLVGQWQQRAETTGLSSLLMRDFGDALPGDGRFAAHARARNRLLETVDLGAFDYLWWIDVDIIDWPWKLLDWALEHNPDGVSAPAVVLHRYVDRFYDTLGFQEAGNDARLYPPWFDQVGPIIELECVGCCYIIPTAVYRAGAYYDHTPLLTEHYSVMGAARAQGRRVLANLDFRAVHAYLPEYGEPVH